MLSDPLFRLRALFRSKALEAELDEELRLHFDLQVDEYLKSGMPQEEAYRRARLAFGGLDQVKEQCRDARGIRHLESLVQDVRYGFRMLRKSPAFTTVTLLTLAVGIGANTAIFSAVNALLLNPYRFPESHRVVRVEARHISGKNQGAGYRDFLDWRQQNDVFDEMAIVPWTGTYTFSFGDRLLNLETAGRARSDFDLIQLTFCHSRSTRIGQPISRLSSLSPKYVAGLGGKGGALCQAEESSSYP